MAVNKGYRYPLEKMMIIIFPIITLSLIILAIGGLFAGGEYLFTEI